MANKSIYNRLFLLLVISIIEFSLLIILSFFIKNIYIILLLTSLIIINIFVIYYFYIYKIKQKTDKILLLFSKGVTYKGLEDIKFHYSESDKKALKKIIQLSSTESLIVEKNRQSQYLALQNQINPHFLYNTLDSIRSEALLCQIDTIANMTEALSKFFQYTISTKQNLVTLDDELRNVKNYFSIQKYRFGNKINLIINEDDFDLNLLEAKMPKITLQPIVENAIIHGLEPLIKPGFVKIKITNTNNKVIILISDNGVGVDSNVIESINKDLTNYSEINTKKGIALANVNQRIKLLFGEDYGLVIRSVKNLGTDVEITLPLIGE